MDRSVLFRVMYSNGSDRDVDEASDCVLFRSIERMHPFHREPQSGEEQWWVENSSILRNCDCENK